MTNPRADASSAPAPHRSPDVWDEAFLRVESYLRAHHLEGRVLLNRLATEIIREARARTQAHAGEEPVAAAMLLTHARIGAWFAQAGIAGDWSDERVRVRGRLAALLADLPGRWSPYFLSAAPVPLELATALASHELHAGPELRLSPMPPAPLAFGFADPGHPSAHAAFRAWPSARAAASWLTLIGLFAVGWAASH